MSGLRYLTHDPANAGVDLSLLDGSPLGQSSIYIRNNFAPPERVDGVITVDVGDRRFNLLAQRLIPTVDVEMVLECAGNGRIHMDPIPEGTPWDLGGASPVVFGGVPLLDALGAIPADARCLLFTGADSGKVEPEGEIPYQFSLSRDRWDRAILATRLGGEPLSHDHGGPVRLVVPGDYAMKSVKWLRSIAALDEDFEGHFVRKYRYFEDDSGEHEGSPVSTIRVRSIISHPVDGEELAPIDLRLEGSAWSGNGAIEKVEVSINESEWTEAGLVPGASATAAVRWRTPRLDLAPGPYSARVRATDSSGETQPPSPRWNRNGYANNLIHEVSFTVG